MKFLISGATGLVGTALAESLRRDRHEVTRLVRPGGEVRSGDLHWDPSAGALDLGAEGTDCVVHLAGASIADGRWNAERKQILRSSRVDATEHLVAGLARLKTPPKVLVCASAIGYYGERGEELLTEESPPGSDFLSLLARDWEGAAAGAEKLHIRTVMLRFGIILAAHGGALAKMLPPFKFGLGGKIGSGKQWMSWLTLEDAVGCIRHGIENAGLRGPVNAVTPNPVRNSEFTRVLGRALHRPAILPLPSFVARAAFGEMADALLLSSQRVVPRHLEASGYHFHAAELEGALRTVLHKRQ